MGYDPASDRYSTSYGTEAKAFTLVNAKASVKLYKFLSAEAGLNNIFDVNYSLVEGFPEAGRNFFVNLVFSHF
nr:TonB-dependent receptor [Dyadobacter sp. CECT 9623]